MRVADVMETDVKAIEATASLGEAVELLAEEHVSGLPVLDSKGSLVGVLSTTDILQATAEAGDAESRGRLFADTQVREVMTRQTLTVAPDDQLVDVAKQILYLDVHRLFVVVEGKLEGVISQTDLVRALALARI